MMPRTPTSTLFPYTTLFRSETARNCARAVVGILLSETLGAFPKEESRQPDRKSTRLNSSHANISYAVFCLKKKKTKNKHSVLMRTTKTKDTMRQARRTRVDG